MPALEMLMPEDVQRLLKQAYRDAAQHGKPQVVAGRVWPTTAADRAGARRLNRSNGNPVKPCSSSSIEELIALGDRRCYSPVACVASVSCWARSYRQEWVSIRRRFGQ
jgi:hypothetical protein